MRILSNKNTKQGACVQHAGKVISVTQSQIEVSIISLSACSACHAKTFCAAFDQKEKNIIVPNIGQNVHVGDSVNIKMKQSLGVQAVVLAYLVPVFVVIVSLLILTAVKLSEPISGLLSLASLAVYYIVLYLFQGRLKKVYNFQLVKIE